jgi:hypothetical protein
MSNFNSTNGLEQAQRAAFLLLFDHLNSAITFVEGNWTTSDQTFASQIGISYVPLVIERIQNANFYEGHRPSLITAPIEKYPNVCVWGVRSTPSEESIASDNVDIWNNLLFVEIMCKSVADENEVNKRTIRTAEAIHLVMISNPTLSGVVTGLNGDMNINMSDVFLRRENTSYGNTWFWQGARLEYVVRKDAVLPSSRRPGPDFTSGISAADMALIDQP